MARYIDADLFYEDLFNEINRTKHANKLCKDVLRVYKSCTKIIVKRQPIANVKEVVCGEWEHLKCDQWYCSNCQEIIFTEGSWEKPKKNFCFNCGADMRGVNLENNRN